MRKLLTALWLLAGLSVAQAEYFTISPLTSGGGGSGTVTSVGLTLPSIFGVSGSPVTTSGTLAATLNNQTANLVFAGPSSGGAATPTFRSLVTADIPAIPISTGVSGLGANVATALGQALNGTGAISATTSPVFVTPTLGVATSTSEAIGGATIGSNALAWTGSALGSDTLTIMQATANHSILASTGYSLTGSSTVALMDLAGTWNTSGVVTGAIKLNITDTAHGALSRLIDLQAGGTTAFAVGFFTANSTSAPTIWLGSATPSTANYALSFSGGALELNATGAINFAINGVQDYASLTSTAWKLSSGLSFGFSNASGNPTTLDTILTRAGAAIWQYGAANAASVVNQTVTAQGSRVGTDTNTVGANLTIKPGVSTGNVTSSALNFNSWVAVASGSATQTDTLTLQITAGDIFAPNMPSDSGQTDATVCRDSTSGRLYKGSGTLGICLGTSSARFKQDFAPLSPGLAQIAMLKPLSYRYLPGHGDDGIREQFGFTAEDVAPILPTLVGRDMEGRPNTVDMLGMLPIMVKSIQELNARVRTLEGAR